MRVLIISADKFEDTELLCPMNRLLEEGCIVDVASFEKGRIKGKKGYEVKVNIRLDELPDDPAGAYDLLLLPGGKAPAKLRRNEKVLETARSFDRAGKPVAAICHAPQILISAGLMEGRRATAYSAVADELKEAGAIYEDTEVVVEGNYIFSRHPGDLPAFNREIIRKLKHRK
ncbi:MAG: type 1 glutamine amidotransferase domain-containing protein [Candidatus Marinimicrobia bacterium]|nr:type 1 glutamine amidotransferase domain-containing protein [Candidatus Neomarinimicrobiota bacterium]